MDSQEALNCLLEGNSRFAEGEPNHPTLSPEERAQLSGNQAPRAVVFGCSDSRVPPELIFDSGIGDLFVIRTAGHVLQETSLASIEYGAVYLRAPLVVVLGHSRCGAVTAAVTGQDLDGHLPTVSEAILLAVENARGQSGDTVDNAARAHARLTANALTQRSALLRELVDDGALGITSAFYQLETGRVEILD